MINSDFLKQIEVKCLGVLKKNFYKDGAYVHILEVKYDYTFDESDDYENPLPSIQMEYGRYLEEDDSRNFNETITLDVENNVSVEFIAGMFYGKLAAREWGE